MVSNKWPRVNGTRIHCAAAGQGTSAVPWSLLLHRNQSNMRTMRATIWPGITPSSSSCLLFLPFTLFSPLVLCEHWDINTMEEPKPAITTLSNPDLKSKSTAIVNVKETQVKGAPEPQLKIDIEHMPVANDPRKWSNLHKVAFGSMMAGLGANIQAAAIIEMEDDLRATAAQISWSMSLFMLLQGVFPLLVYIVAMAIFTAGSVVVATSKSIGLSSAVLSIGAATLADIYDPVERGQKMGLYYVAPLLGASLAPLIGGGLTNTYRSERSLTYQHVLKAKLREIARKRAMEREKVERASDGTGSLPEDVNGARDLENQDITAEDVSGLIPQIKIGLRDINPYRPLLLTLRRTYNIYMLLVSGLNFSFEFAVIYTSSRTLGSDYHYSPVKIGLTLLSFGIGTVSGSIIGGRWSDYKLAQMKAEHGAQSTPEMRLRSTFYSLVLFPLFVVGYAWVFEERLHVAVVCVMLFFCGFFAYAIYACTLTYIVDSNVGRSGGAVALNSFFRCSLAFAFEELAVPMQDGIGDGCQMATASGRAGTSKAFELTSSSSINTWAQAWASSTDESDPGYLISNRLGITKWKESESIRISSGRVINERPQIITDSIDTIENRLADASTLFPSLDEPMDPTSKVESILVEPDMSRATSHIVAAAAQLMATVRQPVQTIMDDALAAKRLLMAVLSRSFGKRVLRHWVAELIVKHVKGIHVNDIAAKNNTDPQKLGDKNLVERHVGSSSVASFAAMMYFGFILFELRSDEGMKCAALMPEHFLDPETSFSGEPQKTPFNRTYGTDLPFFDWYAKEENEAYRRRFGLAMLGSRKFEPANAILLGFKWEDLPKGSKVVDVGGGIGSLSLIIAEAIPDLNFVIQDSKLTVTHAVEFWNVKMPSALESGRVKLQGRIRLPSSFDPTRLVGPICQKDSKEFKSICHPRNQASDSRCHRPYSCNAAVTEGIPGASKEAVPVPLLPSLGKANSYAYQADMSMWAYFNGQNRTLGHSISLSEECGWKVVHVHYIPGSSIGQIVCVPM
ncbi:hypothetical protein D9757_009884 [Collybiopsis confluens]|uniref:O-methyltransferase domain-containing protein n=1 Tax=Collybiopsis confluens TaxID=2823264 RepID=A0A8H5GU35_9AGAR|nr:hypothetical protein D9757_009884 [Collybiopsis confluens]